MIAKAHGRYLRLAPMKTRQLIDLIRGKDAHTALVMLAQINKGPSRLVSKVLKSAVSNAKQQGLTEEQLFISKITATAGPMWKRYRAATFGRANSILKRTTHLNVELDVITK